MGCYPIMLGEASFLGISPKNSAPVPEIAAQGAYIGMDRSGIILAIQLLNMNQANNIKIHVSGQEHSHTCPVVEDTTVESVISALLAAGLLKGYAIGEVFLFREDGDEEIPHHHRLGKEDMGKRFHAHRCREIEVAVQFLGTAKDHRCRPGTTIRKVLNWAKANFPIDKGTQYELRLTAEGNPLDLESHVGSYAHECKMTVYLTPDTRING